MKEPDDFQQEMLNELEEKFQTLCAKHKRRLRSPLKFREAYDDFLAARKAAEGWAWPGLKTRLAIMDRYLSGIEEDYKKSYWGAENQKKQNQVWDSIYHPPPRAWEGGRADGNSR